MQQYFDIGDSFKRLLKQYIDNLENYAPTDDEIKLIKDIKKIIQIRGVKL